MRDQDIRDGMFDLAEEARPAYGLAETALRRARGRRRATRIAVAGGSALAVTMGAVGVVHGLPLFPGERGGSAGTQEPGTQQPGTQQPGWAEGGATSTAPRTPAPKRSCSMLQKGGGMKSIPCPAETDRPAPPKAIELPPIPRSASNLVALWVNKEAWYVADADTGELKQTRWFWVSASPDGKRLAILEKRLASRIGIVDRATGKVERWIGLSGDEVSSVFWSPKGDRLVATAFEKVGSGGDPAEGEYDRRTGFVLADPDSGTAGALVPLKNNAPEPRDYWIEDLVFWAGDGSELLTAYEKNSETPGVQVVSPAGKVTRSLPGTGWMTPADGVATSPDNRYVMTEPDKTKSRVIELESGRTVERTRSFGAEAWLSENRFIGDLAWDEITAELAIVKTDGTVVDRLWKAPKDVTVDAMALTR